MKSRKIIQVVFILLASLTFSQNVNEFTGSLSYGMPLMTVPSNRGNGIPINAGYNAGISVKQPASEIGLGWYLSAGGAITRNVSGIADDIKNGSVWNETAKSFKTENGTLYTPGDADIYHTKRNMDSLEFSFPDYDSYFVSGPGIGGKMTPFIFDYEMYYKDGSDANMYKIDGTYYGKTRSPQFHFNGDFADTLASRHYSVTPVTAATPFKLPGSTVFGFGGGNDEPYLGKHLSGSTISGENFDQSTNRLGSANYVEYFRNGQIDTASGAITGFIDFQTSHTRASSTYPTTGIGAFRITNSAGFIYHYSLPVYINKTESHSYPLKYDYSVPSYSATLNSYTSSATSFAWTLNTNVYTKKITQVKYAYQWLLTAITGPDYVDANSNHVADDGDTGYWISFDYKQWSSDFTTRFPHYGFDYSFDLDEGTKRLPYTIPTNTVSGNYKLSGKSGNVSLTYQQIYYLNKIKTTSHTAIFVKDIRRDEVSSHTTTNYTSTITPTPQLRTTRIILFKNDSLDSIVASKPTTAIPATGTNTVFSFSGTNNGSAYFFTEDWYTTNVTSDIKNRVLKHIEFTQDYSLCRNYHGNVAVSSLTCSVITPPATVQSNIAATTYSTSGKLTLTKIQQYELQNVKIVPSYTFDYNQSVSNDNPDYNPIKVDYWGYYKSDVSSNGYSGYTSSTSKDYTDAWSLRKITQPMGGYTEFEYESNSYSKVLDNTNGYRGATFIYPIAAMTSNTTNTNGSISMEESTSPTEFPALLSGTITGCTKNIVLPFGQTSLTSYPDAVNYGVFMLFGDFSFTGSSSPYSVSSVTKWVEQNPGNVDCFHNLASGTFAPYDEGADYEYSCNGYLMFQRQVGDEVYGDGPRVKRISTSNDATETYVTEYTYENGVATLEADRFEYPEEKASCGGNDMFKDKLTGFSFDKHSLGPRIGYNKVTTKNLGRANTANGSVVNEFVTSYTVNGSTIPPNHKIAHSYTLSGTSDPVNYYECFDKYSPYWGLPTQSTVLDVNNNVLSKVAYEYETTDQGALVENFLFLNEGVYNLSILRHYPAVLKKTKSYGMGSYSESQILKRDEVTGETLLLRNIGQNGSSSLSSKVPAFRLSAFSTMGPKSVSSSNKNFLSSEAYSYSAIDTTLTSSTNSSFLAAGVMLYKTTANLRIYSSGNFATTTGTLAYWKQGATYGWSGIQGSLDEFGLYKRSELSSNAFNFSSPSSSSTHWRFGSETSLSDNVGHALETRSFNNRFNSIRLGNNYDYIIAACSNSNYNSSTYSGFESIMPNTSNNYAEGELYIGGGNGSLVPASTITPHTGYNSLSVPTGGATFFQTLFSNNGTYETGIERGRTYRAIVWVSTTSPSNAAMVVSISGSVSGVAYSQITTIYQNDASAITIGSWKRLSIDFKIPDNIIGNSSGIGTTISLMGGSTTSYFDDFMLYPVEGSLQAKVYNPGTGRIVAELNNMGYATFYTYDEAGRLLDTKQEFPGTGIKLVKRNSYNFARTN
jgi:hypothetical protein